MAKNNFGNILVGNHAVYLTGINHSPDFFFCSAMFAWAMVLVILDLEAQRQYSAYRAMLVANIPFYHTPFLRHPGESWLLQVMLYYLKVDAW